MPAETIDRLQTLPDARFVTGNADRGLVERFDGKRDTGRPGPFADWCATQIDRTQRDFLAGFEKSVTIEDVDGLGRVLFCHATPSSDKDVFTVVTPEGRVAELMAGVDAGVVVCGHTHMQFHRRVERWRIVNAGSVGMPNGETGAYWAMIGPEVDLRRTEYDLEAAARRIRAKDWDQAEWFVNECVLTVPSTAEVLEFMRGMEPGPGAQAG